MPGWNGSWRVLFQHTTSSPKLGVNYVQASSPTTTLELQATASTLVVGQDLAKYGIAGVVWNCARAMMSFFEVESQFVAQFHVLELGAGPGAVGLALASVCEVSSLLLTDLESVVPLTRDNARLAAQQHASIATLIASNHLDVQPLCWGEPLDNTIVSGPVDVVVASDCLYESVSHSGLLSTLLELTDISKHDTASRHCPIVLLAYKQRIPDHHQSLMAEEFAMGDGKKRHALLTNDDVFAEEQQARQDELDALVGSLAQPTDLEALQSFLASDAAQKDKIDQLVNFLADGPVPEPHNELVAETDIFADEQEKKQKELDELVDSLSDITVAPSPATATATALLASDANDVDFASAQASFLNVIGGAVLLLVAVVLVVVTKRTQSKREEEDERKDFGYSILYE
ncbi:hypothetical protein AM588_10002813 [Phytophthora nicotianae]|uniref:Uncharacterized protein n=1 Tax=Phytophthora nicotianae TaxID=4792 RepID=A0A0W8D3V1_PHYNI|nr:hypothetical protein AM588_10002813 [Phytophthora nicotianae]